jgi:hypothetical protein
VNDSVKQPAQDSQPAAWYRPWISPKKVRFWLLIGLVLYTLGGFFLAPRLLENMAVKKVSELGRSLSVGEVKINPFLLTIQVLDSKMHDTDGVLLISYDEYFWDFELSSLFHWAWTFREIRLNGFFLNLERFRPGEDRIGQFTSAFPRDASETAGDSDESGKLPRIIIQQLRMENGRLGITDHVGDEEFKAEYGPISVEINDLSTLPDQSGRQQVSITTEAGGTIAWSGNVQISPLRSQGSLTMSGKGLEEVHRYLDLLVPFTTSGEEVEVTFDYELEKDDDTPLQVSVNNLNARASDIRITLPDSSEEIITLPSVELTGGSLRWPEQSVALGSLSITDPELKLQRLEDGSLNLEAMRPAGSEEKQEGQDDAKQNALSSWKLELQEFSIENASLSLLDLATGPDAGLEIQNLSLTVSDFNNQENSLFPTRSEFNLASGGSVLFAGTVGAFPQISAEGGLNVNGLLVNVSQPWVTGFAHVAVESGAVSLDGSLTHGPDDLAAYNGSLMFRNFSLNDAVREEQLAGWEQLNINRLEFSLGKRSLNTSELEFSKLYGRLAIASDKTTNVGDLIVQNSTGESESQPASEPMAMDIVIDGFEIDDASLDFSDLSLPLPFEAAIRSMDGTISTLSTLSAEPARIQLDGQVNDFGQAQIGGSINANSFYEFTDIQMVFRNLEMARLTPYTIQFAGHEIAAGRLDLDLDYKIQKGQMQGANSIVVRELTLGDKVEHPDAMNLPLGLAVALLKDGEGVIDINLPVSGDLNDPEFQIGGIVAKAIFNLITKIITSPFRLLGNLVGVDAEDFGTLSFAAGSAEVSPPDREKLVKMAEAMLQRPELQLAIGGVYETKTDSSAMKISRVDEQLEILMDAQEQESEDLSTVIGRRVMESMFLEAVPGVSLESVQAEFMGTVSESKEEKTPVLDEIAYVEGLRHRIIQQQVVTESELQQLADARADNVIVVLQGMEENSALSIQKKTAQEIEAEGTAVPLELEVTINDNGENSENPNQG